MNSVFFLFFNEYFSSILMRICMNLFGNPPWMWICQSMMVINDGKYEYLWSLINIIMLSLLYEKFIILNATSCIWCNNRRPKAKACILFQFCWYTLSFVYKFEEIQVKLYFGLNIISLSCWKTAYRWYSLKIFDLMIS